MLLMRRVVLLVVSILVASVATVSGFWSIRESAIVEAAAERELNGRLDLFLSELDGLFATMERETGTLSDNVMILEALEQRALGGMAEMVVAIESELKSVRHIDHLELTDTQGRVVYSSQDELFPIPLLSQEQYQRILDIREPLTGIGSFSGKKSATGSAGDDGAARVTATAFLGFPLISQGGQVVGVATYAVDIIRSLSGIKRVTGDDLFVVNRRGRVLSGTDPGLWSAVERGANLGEQQVVSLVQTSALAAAEALGDSAVAAGREDDGRQMVFSMGLLLLPPALGEFASSLVVARDVTQQYSADLRAQTWLIWGVVVGLVVLSLWLWRYLQRQLRPLTYCVGALNSLARGSVDTRPLEFSDRRDEVGQIARSIELLRRGIGNLERMRLSRDRQRLRRERFIRDEMTRLAETLDDESKSELLSDLWEVKGLPESPERADSLAVHQESDDDEFQESGDTLRPVAVAFQRMSARIQEQQFKLQRVVSELQEALGAKDQFVSLQSELGIAQRVQLSMLPKDFPEHPYVEIHGFMRPAKEVGGDFYDFFQLDDDRVGVVIADVSGKGIPAALFMAISRTLQRSTALLGEPPGACLGLLNNILSESNSEELFVTLFYGVYDIVTGDVLYANAGHSPPVILRGRERFERLETSDGLALAVLPDLEYEERSVTLERGDTMFLFTEGVTGATNAHSREFGYDRLIKTLGNAPRDSAEGVVKKVIAAIDSFAEKAPQSDDITCLVLRRKSESADSAYRDVDTHSL